MRRDELDYPAILRTDDDMTGLQDYLDRKRAERAADAQPAIGAGVTLCVAFLLAFVVMFAVAFLVEATP